MSHKFESAHDWLDQHVASITDIEEFRKMFTLVQRLLDNDQIQDIFQDEMDDDGFFEEILDQPDVNARVKSADNVFSERLSINEWLSKADDDELFQLADPEGDEETAKDAARFYGDTCERIGRVIDHCGNAGSELVCEINKPELMAWLKQHKPDVLESLEDCDGRK